MALAKTLPFANFVLLLGDGSSPNEVFTAIGALTSRSFKGKLTTGSTDIPDITDDAAVMWPEQEGKSLSFEMSAEGVYALDQSSVLRTWFLSGAVKNVQLKISEPMASDGGTYAGAAVLTDLSFDAKKAEKSTFSITISSSGIWAFTAATV